MREFLKEKWPIILAILIGIGISYYLFLQAQTYTNEHVETVRVPVAVKEIPPYHKITSGDVNWQNIVKGGEDKTAISNIDEALGKVAVETIYPGEQIKKQRLMNATEINDKQIVAINIDLTRCVGGAITSGDLVDVWWVPGQGTVTPGSSVQLLSTNAIVIDIRDSSGKSVIDTNKTIYSSLAGGTVSSPPAVALLAINKRDARNCIVGASPASQNVVFVKKFKEDMSVPDLVAPVSNENETETENTSSR